MRLCLRETLKIADEMQGGEKKKTERWTDMGTERQSAILPVLRGTNGNEGSVMPGSMQGKSSGCCYDLYEPKGTQRRQSYLVLFCCIGNSR